jgi:hypothetical protein
MGLASDSRRLPRTSVNAARATATVTVLIAKVQKSGQTNGQFDSDKPEVSMGHSQMLKTRRAKQRTRKVLAGAAKRAKKLGKQSGKTAGAGSKEKALP